MDYLENATEILNVIPSGLYIYQYEQPGRLLLIYANPESEKLTGKSVDDILGKEFNEIWPNARAEGITDCYLQVMETGIMYDTDDLPYQDNLLKGTFKCRAFRMPHNRLGVAFENITEKKKAEENHLRQALAFQEIFNSTSEAIFIIHDETAIKVDCNDRAVEMFGYESKEELLQVDFIRLFSNKGEYSEQRAWKTFSDTLEGGQQIVEWQARKKNGMFFWVEASLNTFTISGERRVLIVVRDITLRKESDEAVRRSETRYRRFFEQELVGVVISTPSGKILECNDAFVRIFEYDSRDEMLATRAEQLYFKPSSRKYFIETLRVKKKIQNNELFGKSKSGKKLYLIQNLLGVFDDEENLVQILSLVIDDTKRMEMEQQFIQAMRLESLGTLAGGIAHDFNNILGIILAHSSLLEFFKADEAKFSESIRSIKVATQRGSSLVKQLLTFARKNEASLKPVQINETVNEIKQLILGTFPKIINIKTTLSDDLPLVLADGNQIHQVLLNLCVNARDAMPDGGRIRISTSLKNAASLNGRLKKNDNRNFVHIRLEDNGAGMTEEVQEKVFEPFFTTKEVGKGTGLGLSLVYSIVKSHNGFIDLESQPGKGTRFNIYFPTMENNTKIRKEEQEPTYEDFSGNETVLVIEDEEMLRTLMNSMLSAGGYHVFSAEDGKQGWNIFNEKKEEIDITILDLGLPKMEGKNVLERIVKEKESSRVIVVSGLITPDLRTEVSTLGNVGFLQKPFTMLDLMREIRTMINGKDAKK